MANESDTRGGAAPTRVAITGIGMVNSLGGDTASVWESLRAGRPRMGPITAFDAATFGVADCPVAAIDDAVLAGRVDACPAAEALPRRTSRFATVTIVTADEAVADAGLRDGDRLRHDAGFVLGTMSAGLAEQERVVLAAHGGRRPKVSDNLEKRTGVAAQHVAKALGIAGPCFGVDAACASSAIAIAQGCRLVGCGEVAWCLAGGVESSITPTGIQVPHSIGAIATGFTDCPGRASRPFDVDRCGYVPAEGGCFLVLENEDRARARGARIYAIVTGIAERTFTDHPTTLTPDFIGGLMRAALDASGVDRAGIGWVDAHATSTPAGDTVEARAIAEVMGGDVLTSAPKSVTGHLLGAAGGTEVAFAALSLVDRVIPPTINLDQVDSECPVQCPDRARPADFDAVLSNAFGFGGSGSSIVVERA
jgi:3-oxoacyl-[acyl-carrier-protein] synthase II